MISLYTLCKNCQYIARMINLIIFAFIKDEGSVCKRGPVCVQEDGSVCKRISLYAGELYSV